jgi:hypothetical protein
MKNVISNVAAMVEKARQLNDQVAMEKIVKIDLKAVTLPTDLADEGNTIITEVKAMIASAKEISTKAQFVRAKAETMCKSLRAQVELRQAELAGMTDMNSPEVAAKAAEIEGLENLRRAMDEVSWRAGDAVWSLSIDQRVSELANLV